MAKWLSGAERTCDKEDYRIEYEYRHDYGK